VALVYLVLDGESFGKRDDGSMPLAVRCLLGPYLLGAWLNSRWWTRRLAAADPVLPGILLGRLPTPTELQRQRVLAVVDLCAELPCSTPGTRHTLVPMLDLVEPRLAQVEMAVAAIEEARPAGLVLVCCALGFARSALVVAAWLLRTGDGEPRRKLRSHKYKSHARRWSSAARRSTSSGGGNCSTRNRQQVRGLSDEAPSADRRNCAKRFRLFHGRVLGAVATLQIVPLIGNVVVR
jgi:protein-tyrosine phosphatase